MSLSPKRLQRLVTYRERLEHVQEGKLAEVHRAHAAREDVLDGKQREREGLFAAGLPATGLIDPADLLASVAYSGRLDREIAATRAALVHSGNAVAFEREQLLVRRRDRRAMETLLEHRLDDDRLADRRADLAKLDELALRDWPRAQLNANHGGQS